MSMSAFARLLSVLVLLGCGSAFAQPTAEAAREVAQPGNNQPLWLDAGVLINPGGEIWRRLHEGPFPFYGAIWLVGVPAAILAFWFVFGPIRLHGEESARLIRRFAAWERALHALLR